MMSYRFNWNGDKSKKVQDQVSNEEKNEKANRHKNNEEEFNV